MSKPPTAADNSYRRSLLRRQHSVDGRAKIVRTDGQAWGPHHRGRRRRRGSRGVYLLLPFREQERLIEGLTWATATATADDVSEAVDDGGLDEQIKTFIDAVGGGWSKPHEHSSP